MQRGTSRTSVLNIWAQKRELHVTGLMLLHAFSNLHQGELRGDKEGVLAVHE